ncbi:MAG: substrate-binding domain-containing protein [Opitutaceae bacterium]|nr:substrate-binding domain-containing protein [Opitutaceae bacterium]
MKRLRLVFITCAVGEDFFKPVQKGMRDAAALLDADCTFIGTEDVDLEAQVGMVRQAIADRVDGIALNIIHPTAFNAAMTEAGAAGIPVVAFNVDATYGRGPHLSAVHQDLYKAGRAVGERAAAALPDGVKVLMTVHSEGISALEDRLRGLQDVLREMRHARWTLAVTGIHPEGAADVIARALAADPEITAVLATGQADTQGAGWAAERAAAGRRPYAAGFDLSSEILRMVKCGAIAFTVDQQPYLQGFYPVLQLTQYLRYGLRPASVDAGATIITRDDVDRITQLSAAGFR